MLIGFVEARRPNILDGSARRRFLQEFLNHEPSNWGGCGDVEEV
jgi:hypothetical protein